MTKADRDFVELTSRVTAHDVVEEMAGRFPCKENTDKIQVHETILKNGLSSEVKRIKKWCWWILSVIVIYGVVDKVFF